MCLLIWKAGLQREGGKEDVREKDMTRFLSPSPISGHEILKAMQDNSWPQCPPQSREWQCLKAGVFWVCVLRTDSVLAFGLPVQKTIVQSLNQNEQSSRRSSSVTEKDRGLQLPQATESLILLFPASWQIIVVWELFTQAEGSGVQRQPGWL